jgi:hypothetical protein
MYQVIDGLADEVSVVSSDRSEIAFPQKCRQRLRPTMINLCCATSFDPPLLLVCVAKSAYRSDTFFEAPHFAVKIVSEDQKSASGL